MQFTLSNRRRIFCGLFIKLVYLFALLAIARLVPVRADQIIYDDALENGWQNWGWATINYANTSPVHSGGDSISVTIASGWQGIQIWHSDMDSTPYTNLSFWADGGSNGGQKLQVYGLVDAGGTNNFALGPRYQLASLPTNNWQQFNIPLTALGAANQANFTGFVIQDSTGATQPAFYVDDVALQSGPPAQPGTNVTVTIQIDALGNRHAISPLIYGVAFAPSSSVLQDLNVPIHRSGGNAETRYNWQLNATSHAADWYFESIADSPGTPGADGDNFIQESKNGGAQAMLTIPIIGWVANLGPNRASLASYSVSKYGPQTGSDPYWSDAGNGVASATGLDITNNDPTDANLTADTNFQAGWVEHLTNTWGTATNGGLKYYIMDNEWSLWDSTHRDVHPVGATMDEVLADFCNYAAMVKNIDPNALVAGPEEWGWSGYLYSGYDQQWSGAHNDYNPADYPDRQAHGGQDFAPWFLNQVRQRSQAAGTRLLDVFTLHCYPQEGSVSGDAVDAATELLRNQSTRVFWDTNYVDPSWINSIIALIPRMKNWVATNYPGTKIGITEYNWGAESYMNGATAQADILGIFGREGLDLATRWTTPATGSPVYNSMKIYRNYDGNDSGFGNISIQTAVPDPDNLAAYAAVRTNDGAMTVMVINKDLLNATPAVIAFTNYPAKTSAQVWQISASGPITRLADVAISDGTISNLVPSQSITLYVVPPVAPGLAIAASPVPGLLLTGVAGVNYNIMSSTNLVTWALFAGTNLAGNQMGFPISFTTPAQQYFRAVQSQ